MALIVSFFNDFGVGENSNSIPNSSSRVAHRQALANVILDVQPEPYDPVTPRRANRCKTGGFRTTRRRLRTWHNM